MKKVFAVLLVLCLALMLFCACGGNQKDPDEPGSQEVLTGEFANDNEANYRDAWKKNP